MYKEHKWIGAKRVGRIIDHLREAGRLYLNFDTTREAMMDYHTYRLKSSCKLRKCWLVRLCLYRITSGHGTLNEKQ